MQKKLNEDFIEEYSEQFAKLVCDGFFAEHPAINGQEILKVTPSKQVNFFVIKLLFNNWQQESQRLESPFFDYSAPEVKEALLQFMNVLSRHIEVKREEFEPLLQDAIRDTLFLIMSPSAYLEIELDRRGVEELSPKLAKSLLKYIKIARDDFADYFQENQNVDRDDIEIDDGIITDEALAEEISKLNEVLDITLHELQFGREGEEEDVLTMDEEDLFTPAEDKKVREGSAVQSEEEVPMPSPSDYAASHTVKEDSDPESKEESEPTEKPEFKPEPDPASKRQPKPASEKVKPVKDETAEEQPTKEPEGDVEGATLSEVEKDAKREDMPSQPEPDVEEEIEVESSKIEHSENTPGIVTNIPPEEEDEEDEEDTLNAQFGSGGQKSIAEAHEENVDSMMNAISVNQRFMFINELFDGDADQFKESVDKVDKSSSFDESVEYLVQRYAKEYHWDMNSDEVKELLKIIFRRFR